MVRRRLENAFHPGQAPVEIHLVVGHEIGTVVECANGDLQALRIAVGHRRAALLAEAAIDVHRRLEIGGLFPGPLDAIHRHIHECAEETAELFLAHATMADGSMAERAVDAEAHGAALAAAGSDGFGHGIFSGGHWSVSWSGCW